MAEGTGNRRHTEFVGVRISEKDRRLLELAAERRGVTLSELLRHGGRGEALRAIGEAELAEEELAE